MSTILWHSARGWNSWVFGRTRQKAGTALWSHVRGPPLPTPDPTPPRWVSHFGDDTRRLRWVKIAGTFPGSVLYVHSTISNRLLGCGLLVSKGSFETWVMSVMEWVFFMKCVHVTRPLFCRVISVWYASFYREYLSVCVSRRCKFALPCECFLCEVNGFDPVFVT